MKNDSKELGDLQLNMLQALETINFYINIFKQKIKGRKLVPKNSKLAIVSFSIICSCPKQRLLSNCFISPKDYYDKKAFIHIKEVVIQKPNTRNTKISQV